MEPEPSASFEASRASRASRRAPRWGVRAPAPSSSAGVAARPGASRAPRVVASSRALSSGAGFCCSGLSAPAGCSGAGAGRAPEKSRVVVRVRASRPPESLPGSLSCSARLAGGPRLVAPAQAAVLHPRATRQRPFSAGPAQSGVRGGSGGEFERRSRKPAPNKKLQPTPGSAFSSASSVADLRLRCQLPPARLSLSVMLFTHTGEDNETFYCSYFCFCFCICGICK